MSSDVIVSKLLFIAILYVGVASASGNRPSEKVLGLIKSVDLGTLASDVKSITLELPMRNLSSTTALYIRRVDGSCSCFKGSQFDSRIAPNGTNEIKLAFDVGRFVDTGSWESDVALSSHSDFGDEISLIHVKAVFAILARPLLIPSASLTILDGQSRFRDSTPQSIRIFVPKIYANTSIVSVGVCSTPLKVQLIPLTGVKEILGDYAEIARLSISLDAAFVHDYCTQLEIPIYVTGSIECKYNYDVTVYLLNK